MRISIYFILLLLVSQTAKAQDWLVTTSADTLKGEIAIELPMERYEEITLKNDDGKQRFKAYQIVEFVHEGKTYKTVKHSDVYRIMLQESEGYLSHFRYRENQGYEFASILLVKTDGESLEISNLTFKRSLSNFLKDCETVVEGFENKKYKRSDLDQIIIDYNNCIDQKTQYISSAVTVKEEPEVSNHPGIAVIDSILKKTDGNSDLNAMLDDIKSKLSKGQAVPGYLKSALTEQAAEMTDIKADVEKLLELLK